MKKVYAILTGFAAYLLVWDLYPQFFITLFLFFIILYLLVVFCIFPGLKWWQKFLACALVFTILALNALSYERVQQFCFFYSKRSFDKVLLQIQKKVHGKPIPYQHYKKIRVGITFYVVSYESDGNDITVWFGKRGTYMFHHTGFIYNSSGFLPAQHRKIWKPRLEVKPNWWFF